MTSHVGRLYTLAVALLVLFLTWTVVAARPWVKTAPDPRLAALAAREQRLRQESIVVRAILRRRWALYRARLRTRQVEIAAARRAQAAVTAAASVARAPVAAAPSTRATATRWKRFIDPTSLFARSRR